MIWFQFVSVSGKWREQMISIFSLASGPTTSPLITKGAWHPDNMRAVAIDKGLWHVCEPRSTYTGVKGIPLDPEAINHKSVNLFWLLFSSPADPSQGPPNVYPRPTSSYPQRFHYLSPSLGYVLLQGPANFWWDTR